VDAGFFDVFLDAGDYYRGVVGPSVDVASRRCRQDACALQSVGDAPTLDVV
jgi:hypothetical protein